MHLGLADLWLNRALEEFDEALFEPSDQKLQAIDASTCLKLGYATVEKIRSPELFLTTRLQVIESHIGGIASNFSIYELLFWGRRISSAGMFYGYTDPTSKVLLKETFTLGVMKYATARANFASEAAGSILPDYLHFFAPRARYFPDQISAVIFSVFRLHALCSLYLHTTQEIRRLNKGGAFSRRDVFHRVNLQPAGKRLVRLYDERVKNNNFTAHIGSYVDSQLSSGVPTSLPIVDFRCTTDAEINRNPLRVRGEKAGHFYATHELHAADLREFSQFANLYSPELAAILQYSVESLITFFCIHFGLRIQSLFDDATGSFSTTQAGYVFETETDLLRRGKHYLSKFNPFKINENQFSIDSQRILTDYSLKEHSPRQEIDLWTRGPRSLFVRYPQGVILSDLTGTTKAIQDSLLVISRSQGEMGNRKSVHFERQARYEIENEFGKRALWHHGSIRSTSGEQREIDCAFHHEEVLFLLECKSVNVSFAFDRGDSAAVSFRKGKLLEALAQVTDKAVFLKRYQLTLDFLLPKHVKWICPLVVSSFAEYLWNESTDLFLTPEIPRVVMVNELKLLRRITRSTIASHPSTISL